MPMSVVTGVVSTMIIVVATVPAPVGGSPPIASSPHPMIIAPSPASTNPDVAGRGANRNCLHNGRRHRRLDNHRSRSHYHRSWSYYDWCRKGDPQIDTDVNPCV